MFVIQHKSLYASFKHFDKNRALSALCGKTSIGVEGEDFLLIPWSKEGIHKNDRLVNARLKNGKTSNTSAMWKQASRGRNVKLKKNFSQHLLTDQGLLGYVVRQADVREGDHILEVGAGTGNLTQAILDVYKERISKLTLVELDREMVRKLADKVDSQGFEFCGMDGDDASPTQSIRFKKTFKCSNGANRSLFVNVDRCDVLYTDLPKFDVFLSNAPFAISKPLMKRLVLMSSSYRSAVLLLQQEFVEKVGAFPGHELYGAPSVLTQTYLNVEPLRLIGPQNFLPPPKVSSRVVRFTPLPISSVRQATVFEESPMPDLIEDYLRFLQLCFRRRNRKLSGILSNSYSNCDNSEIYEIVHSLGFEDKRPNNTTVSEFCRLYSSLALINDAKI